MITRESSTPIAAPSTARTHYGPALQIINILHEDERADDALEGEDTNQDTAIARVLDRATDAAHAHAFEEAHKDPELASHTAFHVGFAACWLLMTAVSGGAR